MPEPLIIIAVLFAFLSIVFLIMGLLALKKKRVFGLAAEKGVQVRSFRSEKLDLEEVFIRAFRGGGRDGH